MAPSFKNHKNASNEFKPKNLNINFPHLSGMKFYFERKNWVIFKEEKEFWAGQMIYFHFFFLFIFFFWTENEANENKVKSRGNERVTVAVVSLMRRCIHQVAATATRISPSPQTKLPPLSRVPPGGLDESSPLTAAFFWGEIGSCREEKLQISLGSFCFTIFWVP